MGTSAPSTRAALCLKECLQMLSGARAAPSREVMLQALHPPSDLASDQATGHPAMQTPTAAMGSLPLRARGLKGHAVHTHRAPSEDLVPMVVTPNPVDLLEGTEATGDMATITLRATTVLQASPLNKQDTVTDTPESTLLR